MAGWICTLLLAYDSEVERAPEMAEIELMARPWLCNLDPGVVIAW